MEAEAEAVDGKLKEAEAKEKLTAVPSLINREDFFLILAALCCNFLIFVALAAMFSFLCHCTAI